MVTFVSNLPESKISEAENIIRLFFPDYSRGAVNPDLIIKHVFDGSCNKIFINSEQKISQKFMADSGLENAEYLRLLLRSAKNALYKALEGVTGRQMPYGSLTGVRPVKPVSALYKRGITRIQAEAELANSFFVSPQKARLICDTADAQAPYIYNGNGEEFDLYVHIPFCPTRCRYCSFITSDYRRKHMLLPDYLKALHREIELTLTAARGRVRAVYVGGGTPSILSAEQLKDLLAVLPVAGELTVEAGRADTLTTDKLRALVRGGTTRISINPQSFDDTVLSLNGRGGTAAEVESAFAVARELGLAVNMDIIAGLEGDDEQKFGHTVSRLSELLPGGITVHTLSLKRGADYAASYRAETGLAARLTAVAHSAFCDAGYKPYYMYRQKYMADNLENVGFALSGYARNFCLFNIDTMEENISILACGAGAITRGYFPAQNRIERVANTKDIEQYLSRFDGVWESKKKLLQTLYN